MLNKAIKLITFTALTLLSTLSFAATQTFEIFAAGGETEMLSQDVHIPAGTSVHISVSNSCDSVSIEGEVCFSNGYVYTQSGEWVDGLYVTYYGGSEQYGDQSKTLVSDGTFYVNLEAYSENLGTGAVANTRITLTW